MKTFRADAGWKYQIDELDYARETENFIVLSLGDAREFKEAKESSDHRYFANFNDAKEWLMLKIDLEMKIYQTRIDKLKHQKQKVNNL